MDLTIWDVARGASYGMSFLLGYALYSWKFRIIEKVWIRRLKEEARARIQADIRADLLLMHARIQHVDLTSFDKEMQIIQPSRDEVNGELQDRILNIARICHEANRAYCVSLGDLSQLPWDEAPQWQRESAVKGVILHLSGDHGPEASHQSWLEEKERTGWKYGPVKDIDKKEHPCFLPFDQLPPEQQRKDVLFLAIVGAFK